VLDTRVFPSLLDTTFLILLFAFFSNNRTIKTINYATVTWFRGSIERGVLHPYKTFVVDQLH
jgi:hypothetical protein